MSNTGICTRQIVGSILLQRLVLGYPPNEFGRENVDDNDDCFDCLNGYLLRHIRYKSMATISQESRRGSTAFGKFRNDARTVIENTNFGSNFSFISLQTFDFISPFLFSLIECDTIKWSSSRKVS